MEAVHVLPTPPKWRLQEVLAGLGVSQRAFAEEMGVSVRAVRKIYRQELAPGAALGSRMSVWLAARGHDIADVLPGWAPPELRTDRPKPGPKPRLPAPTPASTPEEEMNDFAEFLELETRTHFGLEGDPFEPVSSPEEIWMSPGLTRAERILIDGIRHRRITAVCGVPGTGKSTLARRLSARLKHDRALAHVRLVAPASISRADITSTAIAVAIIRDLTGKETSSWSMERRSELLRTTLAEMGAQGITPVLMIDEAHLLRPNGWLAIKQVWDSHLTWNELAVILVGQPKLKETLRTDVTLREVAGRTIIVELPTLTEKHTADYLRWRFGRVNVAADKVFSEDAYKAISLRAPTPMACASLVIRLLNYAAKMGETSVAAAHVGRV